MIVFGSFKCAHEIETLRPNVVLPSKRSAAMAKPARIAGVERYDSTEEIRLIAMSF
jgi:hypothetical protein